MKKWLAIYSMMVLLLSACKKDETRLVYEGGHVPALTATATTLTLLPEDSSNVAVTFTWTNPHYTINGNQTSLKVTYVLEMDTSGGSFARPMAVSFSEEEQWPVTVKELNAMLVRYGLLPEQTYTINARLRASLYWEGSEQVSNMVQLIVTPYPVKPTPKIPVPDNLFIAGSATAGAWANPVPAPAQQLTRIDDFRYGIILPLTGGQHYVLLPNNGSWDHKYAIADKEDPAAQDGGELLVDEGEDIPAPAAGGLYTIIVDFLTGTYMVNPAVAADLPPDSLYIVGNATPGDWSNPVPVPSQRFDRTSACGFTITLPLKASNYYLFLPENGSWDKKYGVQSKTDPAFKEGGPFLTNAGEDIPSPDEDGNYKIEVEFVTRTYRVTQL